MGALPGYLAQIYLSATSSVPFTNLALADNGDHQTFSLSRTDQKRFWDPTVPITVQTAPDNATWSTVAAGTYIAVYCGAIVKLNAPLIGATPSVRVSGAYFPYSFLGDAYGVDIKQQLDIQEVTAFQNPPVPWKTKIATLAGCDITINRWWIDTTYAAYLGNRLAISAYNGQNAGQRYECYALMKGESIKITQKGATTEDLDFTVDGKLYYYQS